MTTTALRRAFVCAALAAASCAAGARPRPAWARIAEPTHVTTTVAGSTLRVVRDGAARDVVVEVATQVE